MYPPSQPPWQEEDYSLKSEDSVLTSSHFKTISIKGEDRVAISNHFKTTKSTTPSIPPSSKTIRGSTPIKSPSPMASSQFSAALRCSCPATSPHTTAQVWDIIALKGAFPDSFDTIGNMPGTYTIRTDPAFPPVQHARHKFPIEYKGQI